MVLVLGIFVNFFGAGTIALALGTIALLAILVFALIAASG